MINNPHLYIKALLEEIQELNKKMISKHFEIQRGIYLEGSIFSEQIDMFVKDIEEMSLEIEQLNQEIINILKSLENK